MLPKYILTGTGFHIFDSTDFWFSSSEIPRKQRGPCPQLTAELSQVIRPLHEGKEKAHTSILIQLRTGKIGFNAFLHRGRVPTVRSPRYPCDSGAMTA